MGCGQSKSALKEIPTKRPKSVTFKEPPVDFVEPRPNSDIRIKSSTKRNSDSSCSIYPPRPPRTKRKEIIPDDKMFSNIDDHVLKAPKMVELSVETLYKYLVKPAQNNIQRCRAFYRWITNNISYDTAAVFQGKKKPVDAESVLKLKTSVCIGYANLFSALCRFAHITVETISGYSKGFNYNPEVPFKYGHATGHAWNAVYIDGDWRLVECAWGAGSCDELKRFHFNYSDGFFFMDPDLFIITHYPYSADFEQALAWQLLEDPWAIDKFNSYLKPSTLATEMNIEFLSHSSAIIFVNGKTSIVLRSSLFPLYALSAELVPEKGDTTKTYTYAQKISTNEYKIIARPPAVGKYKLRILGNNEENNDEAFTLVTYILKCLSTDGLVRPYPYMWGVWGIVENHEQYGVKKHEYFEPHISTDNGEIVLELPITKTVEATSRLNHAEDIVRDCDDYTMTEVHDGFVVIRARLPKEGYYKLKVMFKLADDVYKTVITYLLESKKVILPVTHKLPKCYKTAREWECCLLEPLCLELARGSRVRIRLKCKKDLVLSLKKQVLKIDKCDNVWEFHSTTPNVGEKFCISGKLKNDQSNFKGLYEFSIV